MKKNIVLEILNTDDIENTPVELASICPLCNHAISPTVLFASLIEYEDYEENKVFVLNYCPFF